LNGVKYQKQKGNNGGKAEIGNEILQHHQPDGTIVFRSPLGVLDFSEKGRAKEVEHGGNHLPNIV
jgi:hypothetical protein